MTVLGEIADEFRDLGDSLSQIIPIARNLVTDALGFGTPRDQMVSNVIIAGAIIATSAVGLIATLLLLPIPFVLFWVGVLRLWNPVEERWPL